MKMIDGLIRDIPDAAHAARVAWKMFFFITLGIFTCEMLIMLVIMGRSGIYSYNIILVDSLLLTAVISPLIYFFFMRPLLINVSKRTISQQNMVRINEKLNLESQRLFKVLDGLPASVHLIDQEHKIRFANRYFRENFGEINEQPCYRLLHGRDDACDVCKTFELFGEHHLQEREVQRKNGKVYSIYNYPFVDTDGQQLVLQLGIDITGRKKAEKELLQREKQLNLVLNSMSDTLYTIDKDECITAIYGEGFTKSGIDSQNLIGKRISDLFEPQRLEEFRDAFKKVLNGESTWLSWETQLPTGNLYFQNVLSPVYDAAGQVTHITGIARNVTSQKMLESKIIETEKLMTVGRMSAMISHEFRNSLTSVRMILELLEESDTINTKDKKSLEVALKSVAGMENIVSQLLAFSRPSQMTFGHCDINKVLDDCISLVNPQIKKQGIILLKQLCSQTLPVKADSIKMKESCVNILINAIQALRDNGTVKGKKEIAITTKRRILEKPLWNMAVFEKHNGQTQGKIVWEEKFDNTLSAGSDVYEITFSDNGPGIDIENLKHIFDSFFTTRKEGTGLGLAIVKRTVTEHNGVVIISSDKKGGTSIRIYLKAGTCNER